MPLIDASLPRRTVLQAGAVSAGAMALGTGMASPATAAGLPTLPPVTAFQHGVASGDPMPDRVVIWTRVTVAPDAVPGSGLGSWVSVNWEVSTDPTFSTVQRRGDVAARASADHTVKVDVTKLSPATQYYYRFTVDGGSTRVRNVQGQVSPVGRTRTAPAADAAPDRLRFGVVSCANWQAGYFSAYRHLADRGDLDAVLHLGDYLYEYRVGEYGARGVTVRPHVPATEMITLADYRARHGQYKTDTDLQRLHAQVPWIVTWDDHESANDAWADGAENHDPATEGSWATRKAAARKAYFEWMPLRTGATIYRRLRFGQLVELSMLDLRSYRSQQVPLGPDLAAIDDPTRSITGTDQRQFLLEGLTSSTAQWKLVGNPVVITPVYLAPELLPPRPSATTDAVSEMLGTTRAGVPFNTDQWDGYTADRAAIVTALRDRGVRDAVFLTGDIHSSWACDLPFDAATYPASGSVATELVVPSVTSDNLDDILRTPPRTASLVVEAAFRRVNPYIKYLEFDSHGFCVLDVTPAAVQMDWFFLADRTDPASAATRAASWRVRTGTQQVEPTTTPIPAR